LLPAHEPHCLLFCRCRRVRLRVASCAASPSDVGCRMHTQQHTVSNSTGAGKLTPPTSPPEVKTSAKDTPPQHPPNSKLMEVKERGFKWRSPIQTRVANGPTELTTAISDAQQTDKQRRHGVTDLDNALGGSYNHPQHGSRLRVSDQQPQSNIRHTRRTRSGYAHTSTSSELPLILAALGDPRIP
jgi:hypothetical protein